MATSSSSRNSEREVDLNLNLTNAHVMKTFFKSKFSSNTQRAAALKLAKRDCDVMLSFSTEFERTITYQLAAVVHSPKLTIVFCNSIKRIKNTVMNLANLCIHAEILSHQTMLDEKKRIYKVLFAKNIVTNLLFVTPDQVITDQFLTLLRYTSQCHTLAYLVVDETHNELEWLYGDNVVYREFGILKKKYMDIPWVVVMSLACTDVVNDIQRVFNLRTSTFTRFSEPCYKPNIFYDVVFEDGYEDLTTEIFTFVRQCLQEYPNADDTPLYTIRGLIYCSSEEECKNVSNCLKHRGIHVAFLYKSMSVFEKFKVRLGILKGSFKVITTTGLEDLDLKVENVRFIIHLLLPRGLTRYYEESNIAGQNGEHSKCRIYVTRNAILTHKKASAAIKADEKTEDLAKYHRIMKHRFEIIDYCETLRCRHQVFAEHFGDTKPLCFNKCDNEAHDRDIDKRKFFMKILQLKEKLLKKLITETNRPLDSNLKLLDDACLISRLITEFETLKSTDPELATVTKAESLMKMCEKLIRVSEADVTDSEEPAEVSVNNS